MLLLLLCGATLAGLPGRCGDPSAVPAPSNLLPPPPMQQLTAERASGPARRISSPSSSAPRSVQPLSRPIDFTAPATGLCTSAAVGASAFVCPVLSEPSGVRGSGDAVGDGGVVDAPFAVVIADHQGGDRIVSLCTRLRRDGQLCRGDIRRSSSIAQSRLFGRRCRRVHLTARGQPALLYGRQDRSRCTDGDIERCAGNAQRCTSLFSGSAQLCLASSRAGVPTQR